MPALLNPKYEMFAKGLADGLTNEKAFIAAGYSPHTARQGSCAVMKKHPEILKRRDEIRGQQETMLANLGIAPVAVAARAVGVNKEKILAELWDNAMIAKAAVPVLDKEGTTIGIYKTNIAASNQALHLLGKELGMFQEKTEIPLSEHSNKSVEELRQIVIEKSKKLGLPIPAALQGEFTVISNDKNSTIQ